MQQNSMYEREIDLVEMIKYLSKRVCYMCIGVIVGFIIVMGLQLLMQNRSEKTEEGEMTTFEKEMKEYEDDYAQLDMEIDNLEKSIEEQIAYNNASILMKINPYDKKSVMGQFYIDSDYQIMPELTYQNRDITGSVAQAYQALATTGELAKYINEHLENPIKERYLNELISVTYTGDGILTVEVVHTDIDSARKVYDLVVECMSGKKSEFEKNIGSYTIALNNESESASVDLELKELQVANLDTINTLKENLNSKQDSFDGLVKPTEGVRLKSSILGGILGGFVVLAVYVVLFLTDTTVKTEQDIVHITELPVMGSIPIIKGTQKKVRKDKRNKRSRYMQYGVK